MRHGFRLALGVVIAFLPFLGLCLALGWLQARGILPVAHIPALIFVPMAGIAAAIYAILFAAKLQLRRRFLSRQVLTFEEWFAKYYSANDVGRDVAQAVTDLVAQGIGGGVEPTQVLPTDRLDKDFAFRLCATEIDQGILLSDPLDCLDEELSEWFEQRTGQELETETTWNTIDDVIRDVSARAGQRR